MAGGRLALVAEDRQMADSIQAQLRKHLGHDAFQCAFDAICDHMARDTDGLVMIAAGPVADCQPISRLVQDICLQKLPPALILLTSENVPGEMLAHLEPYVSRLLRWPADAGTLVSIARDRNGRGRDFTGLAEEPLEDLLARKLLAQTPSLLPLVERIALAANHDVTVLLNGETGTGKTFLARLVHDHSPRKLHRFLAVPCGAIAANLIESEFFGHVKGAFTGADRVKVGKFAAVGDGTLLLDEIDTLGLEQQSTLLRVIETGEFEPVGSIETQRCTARLIVASNINLEQAVARGRFRPDLYFRLNVMSFHMPSLRERVQDIAPLARHGGAFQPQVSETAFRHQSRSHGGAGVVPLAGQHSPAGKRLAALRPGEHGRGSAAPSSAATSAGSRRGRQPINQRQWQWPGGYAAPSARRDRAKRHSAGAGQSRL